MPPQAPLLPFIVPRPAMSLRPAVWTDDVPPPPPPRHNPMAIASLVHHRESDEQRYGLLFAF